MDSLGAAIGLAVVAPETPGLAARFWEAARQNLDLDWRRLCERALVNLPHLAPAAEAADVEYLVAALDMLGERAVRRVAAETLARVGVVTAEVITALEARYLDRDEEEAVRQAVRAVLDTLAERLRSGETGAPIPLEDQFLLAIWQQPGDAALRLVYSDWLEENGYIHRAELIRLQIELGRLPREDPRRGEWTTRLRDTLGKVDGWGLDWLERWEHLSGFAQEQGRFLSAVRARPEDGALRLHFADWLEEHGYTDRAWFIRLECEVVRHPEREKKRQVLGRWRAGQGCGQGMRTWLRLWDDE
jgi:uncharacterized protein (TIGR02996 family)